jgi:hypothetical protein
MSTRVLSTDEAKTAIAGIKSILDGDFTNTIAQLKRLGTELSDPQVWDGTLAVDFRSNLWPACSSALDQTLAKLGVLHDQLKQIQGNIMSAGGNAAG